MITALKERKRERTVWFDHMQYTASALHEIFLKINVILDDFFCCVISMFGCCSNKIWNSSTYAAATSYKKVNLSQKHSKICNKSSKIVLI